MAKFRDTLSDKKNKLDTTAIIQRLEKAKRINSEGGVAYEGWFLLQDLVSVLETSLSFSKPLPDAVRRRLIGGALSSPVAARVLTRQSLLKEINVREADYFKRSAVKYFLATSISIGSNLKIPPVKFVGGAIIFSAVLPERLNRCSLAEVFKESLHTPHPDGYTAVTVSVKSRSVEEAFDSAMEELDYIRGLWNFGANRAVRTVVSSGLQRPINPFCLGQVHTLHDSSGKLAVDSYWYNTSFVHHVPILSASKWDLAKASLKKLRRLVKTSRYPADLRAAFIKYTKALDGIDYEVSFIKLWSLLEFLTDCGDGRYDAMVRRCAFLFVDPEYERQILQHLRERRNLFVHAATETALAKSLVFQLKQYVEHMIMFHLRNSVRFASREETAAFLDLPYDPEVIRERIRRLKIGLKFRRPTAKPFGNMK